MSESMSLTSSTNPKPSSGSPGRSAGKYDPDKPGSFSSLDLFEGCERKFYYEKVEGAAQAEGAPLVVGSCYHEVLADLWRPLSVVMMEEAIDQHVSKVQQKLVEVGVDADALRGEIAQNVERLSSALFGAGKVRPLYHDSRPLVECTFDSKELGYRGVIDLVSPVMPLTNSAGGVVGFCGEEGVLDYKVVSSDRRRSERDARFSTQLALYCLVMGVSRAAFVEIPRNLERPILVRGAVFSPKELENARRYLVEAREAIKSRGVEMRNFKRAERSYPLCSPQWCQFWDRCYG